jgi:epoxyqueuosine reductase
MLELLKQEIVRNGDRGAIVPVGRLREIRQDIEDLKGREPLNAFQRYIVNDLHKLDPPETDFEIRSVIIVASPSPSSARLIFTWKGERIPFVVPGTYVDDTATHTRTERYLRTFLASKGRHVECAPRLPRKLLAVRSGLGAYGRNNICYVEGMGSFLILVPFVSDVPCTEDTWHDIRDMEICRTCQACFRSCPTAAIRKGPFLLDNERCLTYFNESDKEPNFPEWIDPSAHHTLYGCLRCQTICPVNKRFLTNTIEAGEFSEEETAFLLEGKSFDLFPESLKQKVTALDMVSYLGAIPRNLRALLVQRGR